VERTAPNGHGPLLDARVAVITGGGGGIGAAAAQLFADHGAHVVIAEIDETRANEVAEQIRSQGGAATAIVCDIREEAHVERLRDRVLGDHGRIDVLVNNAGHFVSQSRGFVEEDRTLWTELYNINLLHVLVTTHAFLPAMIDQKSGSIINVSSVEGLRGYPAGVVYGALKAAVVQFTRSLAVQVGIHGVRVNGIGPDVTESLQVPYSEFLPAEQLHLWPMWVPVGRMGLPVDQARVLLFLASDLSSFVTGHTIPTDGGTGAAGGWFRSESRAFGGTGWTNRPINP